jgi:hypothetical protein
MVMFGTNSTAFGSRPTSLFSTPSNVQQQQQATTAAAAVQQSVAADIEIVSPPDDTVQALKFNPGIANQPILLASGSWDNLV